MTALLIVLGWALGALVVWAFVHGGLRKPNPSDPFDPDAEHWPERALFGDDGRVVYVEDEK